MTSHPLGAPILLLHGQPGSARDWDRVAVAIGDRAETIAITRPGWDGHGPPAGLEGNVAAALRALDAAGVRRATVVGHSFGAAVAASLAAEHSARVAGLVLVAPAANEASLVALDKWLATPVAGYLASIAALAGLGLALFAAPVRRRIASDLTLDDRYLEAAARRLLSPAAWRAFVTEQRALVRELPAVEAALANISAPTRVVVGTADRIVPVSAARALTTQIGTAELVLLDHAGHLIPQQHPDELAEVIAALGPLDCQPISDS